MAKRDDSVKKKVPELRFKGFTDDWEQRKIKDIFKITRGQVLAATEISEEKSDISPFPVYSSQTKNNGLMGYYKDYLFDTAITWTTDGANAGTVSYRSGRFYSTNVNGVLISDKGYTNKAISEILNLEAWKWVSHVGNPKLMNNVMGDISIMIPSSFEEQDRLSDFLNQLDDTIALHQRKLDLLKEQKKGFLQKMFPKNGEKVPELRFAGFADDWEERKLGELSQDTFGGGTPKTSVTEYWNGEIPWIQSSDLSSDHLFGVLPKKHITENAVKNSATKLIPKNSIAIVTRVGVGKLAFMPYEFTSSQDFLSLSNLQVDCNFGVYSIYKILQRELNNIQGTSIKGITKADLLDKEVIIPVEFEEQQKIGSFFKQLDDTITLHQRKLDLLKEQKKGFLQKMFV
ncbi:MAG TPA: restriction endonuclease subunit S [Candidatus Streptococcus faecavium]|uniref:Restriction endonuclease subunit S n=1 Tax=Candidatus Streptococcus faecavium TaxID=2838763 RepID=A0A9D2FVK3_9STRE|nr:restriction endonuclease subunit S [Candidatus Streptococcus faecavium]